MPPLQLRRLREPLTHTCVVAASSSSLTIRSGSGRRRDAQSRAMQSIHMPCRLTGTYCSGCQRGMLIVQTPPHTHRFVRGRWRGEEPAAYTHDLPPSPAITYACACGHPPPAPDIPVATTIPARPPPGIHVPPKPLRSVPGITSDSRTSACPPPNAPLPGPHVGP